MLLSAKYKILSLSLVFTFVNIFLFIIISTWSQLIQIFNFSQSFFSFLVDYRKYLEVFFATIDIFTLLLFILFLATLFTYWYTYFSVYFMRIVNVKMKNSKNFFANILILLGFGCVACGQTLLYSILLFFGAGGVTFLGQYLGSIVFIIGLILLFFGIYENKKILNSANVCKI